MRRRHALAILAGAPAAGQEITITAADVIAKATLQFFSPAEMDAMRKLSAILIPSVGGKPGAIEAGAPEFLDFYLSRSPVADQELYRDGLKRFMAAPQTATLEPLNQPWTYVAGADLMDRFLRRVKEDLLKATFNSREWLEGRRGGGVSYYWKPIE